METNVLSQTVVAFYEINNKYSYTKLKNLIAPIICYVERNLNEVSYKKYGLSLDFKKRFTYISNRLDNKELDEFVRYYKRIRALNVHARTFYFDLGKKFNYDLSKLINDYHFLELDVPINAANGDLTIYGMLFILSLLLNTEQFWSLITLISNDKYLGLKQYLTYERKKELKAKYVGINHIRDEIKDIPIIFCIEQFVMPVISETYLIFEEEILKAHKLKAKNPAYLSFPEAINCINLNDDLKKQLIFLRNMWAHGNSFYYTSEQDNTIALFIDTMQVLGDTLYKTIAQNALKKIKIVLLQLKYKRPVEMAIKLQSDKLQKSTLLHRLGTMMNFNDKDDLVPLFIEKKLSAIDWYKTKFAYNNKEEKLGTYVFQHIDVIEHVSLNGNPFIINGIQTDLMRFKEYALPEYDRLIVSVQNGNNMKEIVSVTTEFVTQSSISYGG